MSDRHFGFSNDDLGVAAETMLSDEQVCKAMLIDALKMADRQEQLTALLNKAITCGQTMAQLILLNRAEHAYALWQSFQSDEEDNADAHS